MTTFFFFHKNRCHDFSFGHNHPKVVRKSLVYKWKKCFLQNNIQHHVLYSHINSQDNIYLELERFDDCCLAQFDRSRLKKLGHYNTNSLCA
jgi:hypothetical protein